MKIVKYLLGIIITLAVLLLIGRMLLPSEQHVERSVVIDADPVNVFSLVNDIREFNKWSPWATYDPEGTRCEISGPATGIGSRRSYRSPEPGPFA